MVVGMSEGKEPSQAQLVYRFMCIRCGESVRASHPDELVDKMREHFADTGRPANSGCKRVLKRYNHTIICGFDHSLDDALWHTQRKLDQVQHEEKSRRDTAAQALHVQIEKLKSQLRCANDKVDELSVANRSVARRLQDALAKPAANTTTSDAMAAIARSNTARKRKLTAFLHPDGLQPELAGRAKLVREALGL